MQFRAVRGLLVAVNFGVSKPEKTTKDNPAGFSEAFINTFYFSFMLFFTFRLKGNVLTLFDTKEKRLVVFHWLLGFMVYVSFLAFSKAGSVLHKLRVCLRVDSYADLPGF